MCHRIAFGNPFAHKLPGCVTAEKPADKDVCGKIKIYTDGNGRRRGRNYDVRTWKKTDTEGT